MGKKSGIIVDAKWAGLSISEISYLLAFLCITNPGCLNKRNNPLSSTSLEDISLMMPEEHGQTAPS